MTDEEVIKIMQNMKNHAERTDDKELMDACDTAIKALEQNVKLKESIEKMDKWVHSGNRGNCDYFIVDQVEKIINGLKKDGTVSEWQTNL